MRPSCLRRLWNFRRLDPSHHFFLCDQVIDSLQQTKQALHVSAPLIQHIIRISRLGKVDNPGRSINLGIHRLGGNQLANVLLCLIFRQIEELSQARHLDASVVFRDDADIVLNNTLTKILPSLVGLWVGGLSGSGIEDVGAAEVRTKELGYFGPSHEFVNGEQFEELGLERNLLDAGVFVDSVEEVGLFVVVRGEDNIVDDSLKGLKKLALAFRGSS